MKRFLRLGYCAGAILSLCAAWPAIAEDAAAPEETNLLRLQAAHIERSTARLDDTQALGTLFDDNPAAAAPIQARPEAPLDVVFGFDGAVVTADRMELQVPESAATARVEILVSTLSPQAGFRSVRTDPLKPRAEAQEFAFQPAAARWIMLRFTPSTGRSAVDVAAVKVLGHPGAPASRYAFMQSPAAALDVLTRLKTIAAADVSVSPDEQSLFADAADGKLDQWSYEEAALIASGVRTAQDRAPYLARLAVIEAGAAQAVGNGPAFERGGRLLRWLYQSGALKSYTKDQTDLSTLLDTGNYNCVSSALLYAVVGRHLGLDVRAIEVPDHAFAVLYDGTLHADVETTVAAGFNPDRDPKSLSLFERLTGFSRPPADKRELRREVGDIGLVAVVYYNHGVLDYLAGRNALALADYFRALSLDPENISAVQNTLATLGNWSLELSRAQKFQDAVQELAVGLALAPDDPQLNNDHLAAWQQWATAEIQAGHRDAALAVLRNAERAAPQGGFAAMQTWIYISPAEELAKREDWAGAIAIVDPARASFQGRRLADMEQYEAGLYNRQGLALINRKKWQQAQALYAAAETALPGADLLKQNEKYVWSNWCVDNDAAGDAAGTLDIAEKGHQRFPDDTVLATNEKAAWLKVSFAQAGRGDFGGALKTITLAYARFPDDHDLQAAEQSHWINWGKAQFDAGNWTQGIDTCERGLQRFPGNSLLEGNELAGWFNAGKERFDTRQWQEAIDTYAKARTRFPDNKSLANNELAAWFGAGQAHFDAGQWQEAIDTYTRAHERFPDEQGLAGNEANAWANWGKSLSDRGDWKGAVEMLVQARSRFPADKNLENFERYCWISWVKVQADQSDWPGALALTERGLQRFPDDDRLLDARKVCQAHLGKA